MRKVVVIGFGTGRCGTKSLAAFLNQQDSAVVTHEHLATMFPQFNEYPLYISNLYKMPGNIVGNIGFNWINYIDRLFVDIPDLRVICLDRQNKAEVVDSFYSYLEGDTEGGKLFLSYPYHSTQPTREAIDRTVTEYLFKQNTLLSVFPQIYHLPMQDLNDPDQMENLLDWIEVPEPWNLEMPWLNKRGEMDAISRR